ncbi:MAG: hypothetical protein LBB65_02380 [Burkholderiales bacterium]|jgi:TM2 domain-containing membrane protein YozV|nr:hypothetical protein [Burkholderiales bacterium]
MNPNIEGFENAPTPCRPDAITESSLKRLKTVAVILLMLAMISVALSFWMWQRQSPEQGPWGLAVLPDGQVWLSVDDELWRLDTEGHLQRKVSAVEAGLPGAAAILMPYPDGHLAAWSRRDSTLYLLTADDAHSVAIITPQWPSDLARYGNDNIHYAFAPDGRIAIAAASGSVVALFDAQGRYLARSPAGAFHFTNGLWWANGWWCTDTNRFTLVQLDDKNLTETQRVTLNDHERGWRFLGLAATSRGKADEDQNPLGVVERLDNGMVYGHIVDIFPSGDQSAYPVPESESALEARALAWLGDTLLVTDGQGFAIRRYSADRSLLSDWGDAAVQAELTQQYAHVESSRFWYRIFLTSAIALFLLGLIVALRQRYLEARARKAEDSSDVAVSPEQISDIAGKLNLSSDELIGQRLQVQWPLFLVILVTMSATFYLTHQAKTSASGDKTLWLIVAALAIMVLMGVWASRRMFRAMRNDERFANTRALQLLKRTDFFWPLRQPDEIPCETMMLDRASLWLVLTNQRLLMFRTNAFEARLHLSLPRSALRGAQFVPSKQMPWWKQKMFSDGSLRFLLADGSVITGIVGYGCANVAQRITELITRAPVKLEGEMLGEMPKGERLKKETLRETPANQRRASWQVFASFLIPGLGQWMQNRFVFGLLFFVIWLAIAGRFAYIVWIAWAPRKEVFASDFWRAGLTLLIVCLAAAYDAWRMRGSPSRE